MDRPWYFSRLPLKRIFFLTTWLAFSGCSTDRTITDSVSFFAGPNAQVKRLIKRAKQGHLDALQLTPAAASRSDCSKQLIQQAKFTPVRSVTISIQNLLLRLLCLSVKSRRRGLHAPVLTFCWRPPLVTLTAATGQPFVQQACGRGA